MAETGIVRETDRAGGSILTEEGRSPAIYGLHDIVGDEPLPFQSVWFDRIDKNSGEARNVRVRKGQRAALQWELEKHFHARIGDAALADEVYREVSRISTSRAARILRPLHRGEKVPEAVQEARLALATAAMQLMAAEASSMANGEITADAMRDALRRQRPSLPRKGK